MYTAIMTVLLRYPTIQKSVHVVIKVKGRDGHHNDWDAVLRMCLKRTNEHTQQRRKQTHMDKTIEILCGQKNLKNT